MKTMNIACHAVTKKQSHYRTLGGGIRQHVALRGVVRLRISSVLDQEVHYASVAGRGRRDQRRPIGGVLGLHPCPAADKLLANANVA